MKSYLRSGAIALISGAFLSLSIVATAQEAKKLDSSTEHFMKEAAQGGLAEVTLGQMATSQAESKEVKDFGQRMVTDHSKANEELKKLAALEGVTLPTKMDDNAQATQQRLAKLSGAAFDRAYMEEMVKDHRKDVSDFQQQASRGDDPEVKNWAAQTLPTLEKHLDLAQNTAEKVGVKISSREKPSIHEEKMQTSAHHQSQERLRQDTPANK